MPVPTPPSLSNIAPALASLVVSPSTKALLADLHTQALTEPAYVSTDAQPASAALDRFVALEPDKCALVYLLLRASGARNVVKAGTSFGVSTVYLALEMGQNVDPSTDMSLHSRAVESGQMTRPDLPATGPWRWSCTYLAERGPSACIAVSAPRK